MARSTWGVELATTSPGNEALARRKERPVISIMSISVVEGRRALIAAPVPGRKDVLPLLDLDGKSVRLQIVDFFCKFGAEARLAGRGAPRPAQAPARAGAGPPRSGRQARPRRARAPPHRRRRRADRPGSSVDSP